jgi:hypothetical protein
MNDCIPNAQLKELSGSMLAESDRRPADIPPDLSMAFNAEAQRLTDQLITVYKLVVLRVRSEPDLGMVAASWQFVVNTCDQFGALFSRLKDQNPACGADFHYDQVLDLRNKCHRL